MTVTTVNLEDLLTNAPAFLLDAERLLLYTVVRSLKPERVLEIGVLHGGSTAIITRALDDNGHGTLHSLDPVPDLTIDWETVRHRAHLFKGYSPGAIPTVASLAGGPFDLCFIDGNHAYHSVVADILGVLPYMANDSYLLFHDAHFSEVKAAIDDVVSTRTGMDDCGIVSRGTSGYDGNGYGPWGGLRLVRVRSNHGFALPTILSRGKRFLRKRLWSRFASTNS